MKARILSAVLMLVFSFSFVTGQAPKKTDAEIKQLIISASIASYKGVCACPYSTTKTGKACGSQSAYSKPGGASPLCYEKHVTQKMVDDYRKKNGQ